MTCAVCGTNNSGASLFCRTCGHPIAVNEIVECENHSGTVATGVCAICGKPVCDDCSVSRDGKVYCDEAKHAQVAVSFARLGYAASPSEGDLLAKNLEPNGIPVLLFSARRYAQFCRLTDEDRTSIYVGAGKEEEARRLLHDSALTEFLLNDTTPL